MSKKIILTCILQTFPQSTHSGRIYDEETYKQAYEKYLNKLKYEKRKIIIDKLLKNNF